MLDNSQYEDVMRIVATVYRLLLFLCVASSCSKGPKRQQEAHWMAPGGKPKVLCTTAFVAHLVQAVGGDDVECLTLIQGASDPHSYQLVKGDDEKMQRADLIFFSGLGLEHGPSLANNLHGNPQAIGLGEYVLAHHPEEIIYLDHAFDPHIWMDISLWQKSIPCIVQALEEVIPTKKEVTSQRAEALAARLSRLHEELSSELHAIDPVRRYLVTTHDAFHYFARAYLATPTERAENTWQERAVAPEGLAPDSQLSTADIQRLVDHILCHDIGVLFAESNISRASIRKVADAVGKKGRALTIASDALYADSMGGAHSGAGTYEELMRHNTRLICTHLRQGVSTGMGVSR